jgi:hypothetical protein
MSLDLFSLFFPRYDQVDNDMCVHPFEDIQRSPSADYEHNEAMVRNENEGKPQEAVDSITTVTTTIELDYPLVETVDYVFV